MGRALKGRLVLHHYDYGVEGRASSADEWVCRLDCLLVRRLECATTAPIGTTWIATKVTCVPVAIFT